MITSNILSDFDALYSRSGGDVVYPINGYAPNWNVVTALASSSIVSDFVYRAQNYSLRINPGNASNVDIENLSIQVDQLSASDEYIFHCMVYCSSAVTVTTDLYHSGLEFTEVLSADTGTAISVRPNAWTAVYSNILVPNELDIHAPHSDVSVRISVNGHQAQPIFITKPVLTLDKPFLYNTYWNQGKGMFPDFLIDIDSQQSNPTYPLSKFWHSLTGVSNDVMKKYVELFHYEIHELSPGDDLQVDNRLYNLFHSTLTDPEIMPSTYFDWATMFIGANPSTGIYVTESVALDPVVNKTVDNKVLTSDVVTLTTSVSHTFVVGDTVVITSMGSPFNGTYAVISVPGATTFTYARTAADVVSTPVGANTKTVDNKALTDNVATLTTSVDHEFLVGDSVAVTGVDATFNGTFDIAAVPTTATFTYALTAADVVSAPSGGTAVTTPTAIATHRLGQVAAVQSSDDDYRKWQLQTRVYGYGSGSTYAVKQAAKQVLTGDQKVVVSPNYLNNEWEIHLRTLTSETPDASVDGDESARVLAAVEPSRPQGHVFTHESVAEINFILDDLDFGTFDLNVLG